MLRFLYDFITTQAEYEIVFLFNHLFGPHLNHTDVAQAIHCSTSTVKYWLNRWNESKDLDDSPPIRSTTYNYPGTGPTNCFACRPTDVGHGARHCKPVQAAMSRTEQEGPRDAA